ncbi:class I SAM-dependent methyltransferase [Romeria aff. gracilis LEGE 07310]|uniref:Class I SAM-dependent methyltransferase n=1 Tax=Vasconcelosia minhoensis LEGE 07310 TaxID=915328 RepID=A0A8J7AZT6_9CYAN|nr:class I SAM-dependent methyltransferase [Romeria gracilis]MBE9079467.1 class I SAM-dependent methyltransferase [Romeria aff. gracilis LEGE 07310]
MNAIAAPNLASAMVNRLLAIRPLWTIAKRRARKMMIDRAETIGVPWRETVIEMRSRGSDEGPAGELADEWQAELAAIANPHIRYPDYYQTSFHAYDEGNLGWLPAMEVEVAAKAVHARLWPEAGAQGDAMLRQSYHNALQPQLPVAPEKIVDLGCGVGMSTETLQERYPSAHLTGVDLSPYFLAVAQYRAQPRAQITWHHAPAEATGLPTADYDLVSACLMFHELPQSAAKAILREARRLLRPGGHMAIMDMNPQSEVYATMPPFVLALLKSTEPYLDEYFALDIAQAFQEAGFKAPTVIYNSARHRTILAEAR